MKGVVSADSIEPHSSQKMRHRKRDYPTEIPPVKSKSDESKLKPFMVADTETVLLDCKGHTAYAAGFMRVYPEAGMKVGSISHSSGAGEIETFDCTTDYMKET